jgi:sporulation protein YlmC with PRC-barrel domain
LAICASSALLLTTAGWSDDQIKTEVKTDKHYTSMHHQLQSSSKIMGATVQDAKGETLGKIQDLILFPGNGRIEFGLLSLNTPDYNGKVTAVPWQLFRMKDANTYTLNVDRDKLLSAKMWDSAASVDFTQPDFARQTYAYYGLNWDDRMSVGGRVSTPGGVERGVSGSISTDEDLKFKRPQPDGHNTFPDINPSEKER